MKREHVTPRDNTWGRAINWFDFDTKRAFSGHLTPLPSVGDTFLAEMQSGKLARFRLAKVDPCHDPDDMFFGTAEFVEYAP